MCTNTVQMSETISNFLTSIVTCDESWIHHYDPLSKQQSSVWKRSKSPTPKKIRSPLSAGKVILLLFFDAQGMVLQHWVPRGQTVNGDYYAHVLKPPFAWGHEEEKTGFAQETVVFAPG